MSASSNLRDGAPCTTPDYTRSASVEPEILIADESEPP